MADAWALTAPLVETRPEEDLYQLPPCLQAVRDQPLCSGRILDRSSSGDMPLRSGAHLAMMHGLESLRGYTSLDYRRYREYLQFVGGIDGPLLKCRARRGLGQVTRLDAGILQLAAWFRCQGRHG